MLKHLTTEARNPASEVIDTLSPLEIVRLMNAEDAQVAAAVGAEAEKIAAAIETIAQCFQRGGRLIYIGAGTSGRLGVLDATECPPTFNSPPGQVVGLIAGGPQALTRAVEGAEDRPELAEQDLQGIGLTDRDVVVGIATSGRTPYVIGGLNFARQRGAFTIALSCNAASTVADSAELAITPIVGPEVISGSTRLKAGTATKLVLNMLTTGAMVRIGKTYRQPDGRPAGHEHEAARSHGANRGPFDRPKRGACSAIARPMRRRAEDGRGPALFAATRLGRDNRDGTASVEPVRRTVARGNSSGACIE